MAKLSTPTMSTISRTQFTPTARQLQIASLFIIWLGFLLRLQNLGGDSFWIDEILTVGKALGGLSDFLNIRDHPPFMYAVTSLTLRAFGETEFAARLPALVAGTLALPLTVLLGKVMRWPVVGLWAALLLAFSPVHVTYAQEARHYALLLAISLAAYILVFQALKMSRWSLWVAFALMTVLNLYNHYGAFIVLASQLFLISGWLLLRWRRRGLGKAWQIWRYPIVAGLLVGLLYLPWTSRLRAVIDHNLGLNALTGTGGIAPLSEWVRLLFYAFGMYRSWLPHVMLFLVLTGLVALVLRREWRNLALIVSATILPLLLIQILQTSRGVFARYVLYMLPFYLLTASWGINAFLERVIGYHFSRRVYLSASALTVALVILVAWPGIESEHKRVQEDWHSILDYLDRAAEDGAVLVGVSMNYRNQFNLVSASLPYYLENDDGDYMFLAANTFELDQASSLDGRQSPVWLIAFDWNAPAALDDSNLEIIPFQTALFVGHEATQSGTSLDRALALYGELTAAVDDPQQSCLFHEDLATLLAAGGQSGPALEALDSLRSSCPGFEDRSRFAAAEQAALTHQLVELVADGREGEAEVTALRLLQYDRNDSTALDVLTEIDLLQLQATGGAVVDDETAPETVKVVKFDMPGQVDAAEVLFIHPPASVKYRLELPESPVELYTRLAMAPESWAWGGDGATFVVLVQPVDGDENELLRHHIDSEAQKHGWYEVVIALADYAGQEVILTLATESGPAGDTTGDWAGWERPRILRIPSPR